MIFVLDFDGTIAPVDTVDALLERFGEGAWVPFFGRDAYTMTLVSRLARSGDGVVLLAYAERLPRGAGYRLVVQPFGETLAEEPAAAAAQVNRALERLIRSAPTQYFWSYNRYKVPPGVEAPPAQAQRGGA